MDTLQRIDPLNPVPVEPFERGTSLSADAWHRLKKNKLALTGGIILAVLGLLCALAPLLAKILGYSYSEQNLALGPVAPNAHHWLGTDRLGRDLLVRLLYGGRISLMVGLAATFVSLTIGVLYGSIAGFLGGKTDSVMMRIVDILYALPFTIFVILLMVFFKDMESKLAMFSGVFHWLTEHGFPFNLLLLFGAIGIVEWLTMARIVRGQVLSLKRMEFIEAAHALGLRKRRIILRHMIPNLLGPVIVYATLTIPGVMLLEAFLSFLGLGVQPPMSSWGVLIKEGAEVMEEYPWLLIYPGLALATTLFCLNFFGDGLRDALDVRASKD
jgi:oligopeptide transport system permease protein